MLGYSSAMTFLVHVWAILTELSPWLLFGAALAGALHVLVPASLVRAQLHGPLGVVKSVLIGVPLPLCSCGVIPAGLGLKKDGASSGAAMGFLVATPQTGVDSVLVSAAFLGWPFALSKVVAALVTGLGAGWLTDAVEPGVHPGGISGLRENDETRTWRSGLEHATELLQTIWTWLVFGIVLSAAITTWLPADAFAWSSTSSLGLVLAMGAALGVSLPLYVCATASVPIAAALVASGMPTGAAMVFLMAGPATNVATIGAVHGAFGRRATAVYLLTILAGSIGFGLGYDALFGTMAQLDASPAHAHLTQWWEHGAGAGLVALLAWFAVDDVRAFLAATPDKARAVQLEVNGLTCGGCAKKLTRELLATSGVTAASVDHEAGCAVVEGTAPHDALEEAILRAGFSLRLGA